MLRAIFAKLISPSIPWKEIEARLKALGAEVSEGQGSRLRIALNGQKAVFHRPHPRKETNKGAVASMKRFLISSRRTTVLDLLEYKVPLLFRLKAANLENTMF